MVEQRQAQAKCESSPTTPSARLFLLDTSGKVAMLSVRLLQPQRARQDSAIAFSQSAYRQVRVFHRAS